MPKNYTAAVGKAASVICVEEVFDDGYQPSTDGKLLLQNLHPFFIKLHDSRWMSSSLYRNASHPIRIQYKIER